MKFRVGFKRLAAMPATSHEEAGPALVCVKPGEQASRSRVAVETETADEEARIRPRRYSTIRVATSMLLSGTSSLLALQRSDGDLRPVMTARFLKAVAVSSIAL